MMTTGYATPTTNAPTYIEQEAAEQQRYDREQQRQAWIDLGLATLGFTQVAIRDGNREAVAYTYEQRQMETAAGLPVAVVDAARSSVQQFDRLQRALAAKDQESLAYCARHQLDSAAANVHLALARAELATSARESVRPMQHALHDLGRLAEKAAQIRAVRNAAPARKRAIELQAQQAISQIDAELQTVELEAAQLGLS
jgi:hypothetical protein